ncbi:MAG: LuxR C-terminal-related transcriptional regulator [Chloroflexota bacterium]|nr:LuxR C-terminal-related transcriptional regulator [Chloroflexota bacterium]
MDTNLSTRETQILRLVAAGMTTKEIAATLSIADSTVNWHVGNALAKLGASSRAEAVAIMLRDGPAEAPVVVIGPRPQRPVRSAWPVAATVALVVMLAVAGGTSIAALYFGTHQAPAPDRDAPSLAPTPTTAPATTGSQPPAATPAASVAPQGAPATTTPVITGPSASAQPVLPIVNPVAPLATATATAPAHPTLPSLTPSLTPSPPLPGLPLR